MTKAYTGTSDFIAEPPGPFALVSAALTDTVQMTR